MAGRSPIEETMRYYRMRAREYEAIYYRRDPERRRELETIAESMRRYLRDRSVLEIACGTGYWTREIAGAARAVVATDASAEMLAIAKAKALPPGHVEFHEADAYRLDLVAGTFDAGLAAFWISHVPVSKVDDFLDGFHGRLGPGARVFIVDNLNTPGYGGEFVRRPGVADTFKRRELADGSTHEIIKNYFTEDQLREMIAPAGRSLEFKVARYYWWLRYETR